MVFKVRVNHVVSSLQEEARRHFNCPILEGMELENQGGMGTELNHWEKRLLEVRECVCLCVHTIGSCISSPVPTVHHFRFHFFLSNNKIGLRQV